MQRVQRLLILIALGLSAWSPAQAAQSVTVQQLRLWHEPDNLRLVMDVSDTPDYRLFTLQHPERVVIDLKQAHFRASLPKEFNQGVLSAIRVGAQGPDQGVRVVLDLRYKVEADSFVLKPYGPLGHRLVVDLKGAGSSKAHGHDAGGGVGQTAQAQSGASGCGDCHRCRPWGRGPWCHRSSLSYA